MPSRRNFLSMTYAYSAGMLLPLSFLSRNAHAQIAAMLNTLSQPRRANPLPNPLAPNRILRPTGTDPTSGLPLFDIRAEQILHDAGLVDPASGRRLRHVAWGYGTAAQPAAYPGYSFNLRSGQSVKVRYS